MGVLPAAMACCLLRMAVDREEEPHQQGEGLCLEDRALRLGLREEGLWQIQALHREEVHLVDRDQEGLVGRGQGNQRVGRREEVR